MMLLTKSRYQLLLGKNIFKKTKLNNFILFFFRNKSLFRNIWEQQITLYYKLINICFWKYLNNVKTDNEYIFIVAVIHTPLFGVYGGSLSTFWDS